MVGCSADMTATSSPPDARYNVLVEFVHKHLDFQGAELASVLDMYDIALDGPDCMIVPLPNQSLDLELDNPRPFCILSFPTDARGKQYHFGEGTNTASSETSSTSVNIASILSRCTLVRSVVELWGAGTSIESCAASTKAWIENSGQRIFEKQSHVANCWKVTVHTLGSKYSREEQDAMRNQFSFLDLKGPVRMKDPTNEFILIRETELDATGCPQYPRRGLGKVLIPDNDARPPLAVYFGRVLGDGRSLKGRAGIEEYSLSKRSYLGPTSMDTELSFIMTNLGQVKKGSFCIDPFVGTGSLLISCALRGAYCMGTDIDLRVLRGRSQEENVQSNFRQYGLPPPELVRSDNAIYHRHYRPHSPLYDAIICDPPYGIRAGARKTGSRLEEPRPVLDEHRHDHIAQTKPYPVSDVMADLLDMAARTLVMNGRLVYIIPSFKHFDITTDLPLHECLDLVHVCYQPLSSELGRRMVTMKKTKEYEPIKREAYMAKVWLNGAESAEKCANIRYKIIEAAKKKPGYEEKAAIRKQKRKEHREAKKKAKREATNAAAKDTCTK